MIIGLLISKYTKEEISTGKKYFVIAYKILIFGLLLMSLYFAWYVYIPYFLLAFVAGMLVYFGFKQIYFYLGILFVLSMWEKSSFFNIIMVLIFCFGLIKGGLISGKYKKQKNIIRKVVISAVLFAIPFVLIYFRSFIFGVDNLIFAFVSGAIFMEFINKINL